MFVSFYTTDIENTVPYHSPGRLKNFNGMNVVIYKLYYFKHCLLIYHDK